MEATAEGILVVNNEQHIISYNQKFVDIWQIPEKILSTKNARLVREKMRAQIDQSDQSVLSEQEVIKLSLSFKHNILSLDDGKVIESSSQPYRIQDKVQGRVWSYRDITDSHNLTEKLNYQASHDPLTQLINRRQFEHCLGKVLDFSTDIKATHV